jgi:hypothetical protein
MTAPEARVGQAKDFLVWLREDCGVIEPRYLPGGRWCGVQPLMFTHAIVAGRLGDVHGYDLRWCYHTRDAALAALAAWDGTGGPAGWHRDPITHRRREGGNPDLEIFAP